MNQAATSSENPLSEFPPCLDCNLNVASSEVEELQDSEIAVSVQQDEMTRTQTRVSTITMPHNEPVPSADFVKISPTAIAANGLTTYSSIQSFFKSYNLPVPKSGDWRLCEPEIGSITGVPNSRGKIVATNGIECFIVREDDKLFKGHLSWFVADEIVKQEKQSKASVRDSALDWLWKELNLCK